MVVPGKEVVLEASVSPLLAADQVEVAFKASWDPCQGKLSTTGWKAVYRAPPDCRGSGVEFEVTASGAFGVVNRVVKLEIKKTAYVGSTVFSHPVPGQKVWSPIAIWWDRTLYHNRNEELSFVVRRRDQLVLETRSFPSVSIVELDVPPSPERVVLEGRTSAGSVETAELAVLDRASPGLGAGAFVIDDFKHAEQNGMGEPRTLISDGGTCETGVALRVSPSGEEPFLYLDYHVSKSKRYGRGDALLGLVERVGGNATPAAYRRLVVWLRGDPVRGMASPVYVRVEGSAGSMRTFKIKRMREEWRQFGFPLATALRKSKDERLDRVSIYVDGKDVTPPLGTILFGGMYLEPAPAEPVQAVGSRQ